MAIHKNFPSNPFEIPQKCDMNGETKVKNPESFSSRTKVAGIFYRQNIQKIF